MTDASHAVVTVRTDGEGTRFVARKGLALSSDGRFLIVRDQDDTGSTRFRHCPPGGAGQSPSPVVRHH